MKPEIANELKIIEGQEKKLHSKKFFTKNRIYDLAKFKVIRAFQDAINIKVIIIIIVNDEQEQMEEKWFFFFIILKKIWKNQTKSDKPDQSNQSSQLNQSKRLEQSGECSSHISSESEKSGSEIKILLYKTNTPKNTNSTCTSKIK